MEQSLPVDLNAERAVLGSCLLERDAILTVRGIVAIPDFYLEKHGQIYAAFLACVEARTPPDIVTVANELRRQNLLEQIGGYGFLADLSTEVPTAVHAEHYARIVARAAGQRRLIDLGAQITAAAYDGRRDLADLHREISQMLNLEQRITDDGGRWRETAADGQALWRQQFEQVPFVIEDILPPGTMLLSGKAKTNKTWLSFNLAYAVAAGGRALGHYKAQQGEVLYIDLEMGADIVHERLHSIYRDEPPPKGVTFVHSWPMVGKGFEEWLVNYLDERPFTRLVVVDTFSGICPDPDRHLPQYLHEKRLVQQITNCVRPYRQLALILVHHSRKMTTGDAIDDASGSTGVTGGVDNTMTLTRDPRSMKLRHLELRGRRIRHDDKIKLKWDSQLVQWTIVQETAAQTSERKQILDLLRERPGLSAREIATILAREEPGTRRLLSDMQKAGLLTNMQSLYFLAGDEEEG